MTKIMLVAATGASDHSRRRASLLVGASVFALTPAMVSAAPPPLSPAWFAARTSPGTASAQAGIPSRSVARVQTSIDTLNRAAKAISSAQAVQAAARALGAGRGVADGLAAGGLNPAPGAAAGGPIWQGARLPTQVTGARTAVTVKQTAPQAILNWQTFNVGAKTDLTFDQSAGAAAASTWSVLNRVSDPLARPSQILGSIHAQGQVLLINGNGILFGAGSQTNVNSLVVSTGDLANSQFLAGGTGTALPAGIYGKSGFTPAFAAQLAAVTVSQGASITTNAPANVVDRGGSVILLGTTVSNAGTIKTANGQTLLVAGTTIGLRSGYDANANAISTTLGTEAQVLAGGGAVSNTGVIQASTGDVTLVGRTVTQAGVVTSTTSVTQRGTIHLLADLSDPLSGIVLGRGSVSEITPSTDQATGIDSQRSGEIANSFGTRLSPGALNNTAPLPDRLDLSRIEVTAGGTIDAGPGSVTLATGGQIALYAPVPAVQRAVPAGTGVVGRILVESGATLDVSGALDVTLAATANSVPVTIEGNNLRDSPVNRDTGKLSNAKVAVNARSLVTVPASAADTSVRQYTAGGLLEVSGQVQNLTHTIQERLTVGGTLTLAGAEIVAQGGSVFNIAGGSTRYLAGYTAQSYLLGADGRVYDVNAAPANIAYAGVYGGYERDHPRWGVTEAFGGDINHPASAYQAGYSVGRDGGNLVLSAPTVVFEGSINAGVVRGETQTAARPAASITLDAYALPQTAAPIGGSVYVGDYATNSAPYDPLGGTLTQVVPIDAAPVTNFAPVATRVAIGDAASVATGLSLATPVPASRAGTAYFSAATLSGADLGGLSIATAGTVRVAQPLMLGDGGVLTFTAAAATISAPVTARGGGVTITNVQTGVGGTAAPVYLEPAVPGVGGADAASASGITLAPGASIDTRGIWTNALLDPNNVGGEAFQNGGAVRLDTSSALRIAAGTSIDASAGGATLANRTTTIGNGGAISLTAFDQNDVAAGYGSVARVATNPSTLGGTLRSAGAKGGALLIQVPAVTIANAPVADAGDPGRLLLTPGFFAAGFSNYTLNGYFDTPATVSAAGGPAPLSRPAAEVAPGTNIQVVEPVYIAAAAAQTLPTGSDPAAAFTFALPAPYLINPLTATAAQRAGASFSLVSLYTPPATVVPVLFGSDAASLAQINKTGHVSLGRGSTIAVDPGAQVAIGGAGQITVDGTIVAPGGTISLFDSRVSGTAFFAYTPGVSVWLGPDATLSVAGRAATFLDRDGRAFGVAGGGGTVVLGQPGSGTTDALVVTRPGSVIDVSGSSASIDLFAGRATVPGQSVASDPVRVAGAGGEVDVRSDSGIFLDGAIRAASGGPSAAGGTLSVALTALTLPIGVSGIVTAVLPRELIRPREIAVGQAPGGPVLPAGLRAGDPAPTSLIAQAPLSAGTIMGAGFGTVLLSSADAIVFQGDVTLTTSREVGLTAPVISSATPGGRVTIAAPYAQLIGATDGTAGGSLRAALTGSAQRYGGATNTATGQLNTDSIVPASATFQINADTIDVSGVVVGGIRTRINYSDQDPTGRTVAETTPVFDSPGFQAITLNSQGDVRFVTSPSASGTAVAVGLVTPGALTIDAAQAYPVQGVSAYLVAGFNVNAQGNQLLTGPAAPGITIGRNGDGRTTVPLTAGGGLYLSSGTIAQGGVLRAPDGVIRLGVYNLLGLGPIDLGGQTRTDRVALLPGSVTSVSGGGAAIPYGGTGDGIFYSLGGVTSTTPAALASSVILFGRSVREAAGATLDLSGGGTLTGAAFVPGRGGSVDVLNTPLLPLANPGSTATSAVYAILPGYSGGVATPATVAGAATDAAGKTMRNADGSLPGASLPPAGTQVTIPEATGGLPAGTYTLLPAADALLPGAYRIQINTGIRTLAPGTLALGNGSYALSVFEGIANTGFRDTLPVRAIVTPGAVVRTYASYNETSYADFVVSRANLFGTFRGDIPADAKKLQIGLLGLPDPGSASLSIQGTTLSRGAAGGHGGLTDVATVGNLEVTADGGSRSATDISVNASDLVRLNAATLSLGADPVAARTYGIPASRVTLRSGATVTGGAVFLFGGAGGITVEDGAVIDTVGHGAPAFDSSQGLLTGIDSNEGAFFVPGPVAVVAVSNGPLRFQPPTPAGVQSIGPITIGGCGSVSCTGAAGLFSSGAITFSTVGAATLANTVRYGARSIDFAVNNVNFGGAAALAAATVPAGLTLSQTTLNTLLAGDPSLGTPALRSLTLTASQSVNFFGTVDINTIDPATGRSSLDRLVFNTPSIYGYGLGTDRVTLSTGTFFWNGILAASPRDATLPATSAPAAGVITNGPGTGLGRLAVSATDIVLGYTPTDQPNDQVTLNRNVLGFSGVTLSGSDSIVANNRGTLTASGDLALSTPLLTGAASSTLGVTAAGALSVASPGGGASTVTPGQGATFTLTAGTTLSVGGRIALPSGSLTLNAAGAITLGAGSMLDLAGRPTALLDQTRYGFGGTAVIASAAGPVTQAAGAAIDVSATGADAGSVSVTTPDTLTLDGAIKGGTVAVGSASGASGGVTLNAARLASGGSADPFAAINATLDAGRVSGARNFELTTGDLTVNAPVRASTVTISADAGTLAVNGRIDASGAKPGTIRLAGRSLAIGGGALLDAHASVLRIDADGVPIDAANRPVVELTAAGGSLSLGAGAAIDVRSADGIARGTVTLNAPRTAGGVVGTAALAAASTLGDDGVAISAAGPVAIRGASSIAVNATKVYVADAPGIITQGVFDRIDRDNARFVAAAAANPAVQASLAGLARYGGAFHFRPGVEIDSQPGGNLTLSGDVDLHTYRYNGEPGTLVLRAANALNVYGSVSDGFGAVPDGTTAATYNPDDNGWVLPLSSTTLSNLILPTAVALAKGTVFPVTTASLNYPIVLGADGSSFPVATGFVAGPTLTDNVVLPVDIVIAQPYTIVAGITVRAPIVSRGGQVLFEAGSRVGADTVIPAGATIGKGNVLPSAGTIARPTANLTIAANTTTWPAGASLSAFVSGPSLGADTIVASGAIVPGGTALQISRAATIGGVANPNSYLTDGSTTVTRTTTTTPIRSATNVITGQTIVTTTATTTTAVAGSPTPTGVTGTTTATTVVTTTSTAKTPTATTITTTTTTTPGFADLLALRPQVAGRQGVVEALAPLLPAGSPSWSLRLVGGANLTGADTRSVERVAALAPGAGNVTLNDPHFQQVFTTGKASPLIQEPSVVRTGTGDLDILAGGSFQQGSSFGVYTAGAQSAPLPGVDSALYNLPRGNDPAALNPILRVRGQLVPVPGAALVLGNVGFNTIATTVGRTTTTAATQAATPYEPFVTGGNYQANYPVGGGDVLIAAQGDVRGYNLGNDALELSSNAAVGAWLFRQGAAPGERTAWWINFGTYTRTADLDSYLGFNGFAGIGALGGGNVTLTAGGNAGAMVLDNSGGTALPNLGNFAQSQALDIAVPSTGRVVAGVLQQTGGGDITAKVGGVLNGQYLGVPSPTPDYGAANGTLTDLRGAIKVTAGQIGLVTLGYGGVIENNPKPVDAASPTSAQEFGGPIVVPGDATVTLLARGDLVLDGVGDAGRLAEQNLTPVAQTRTPAILVGGVAPLISGGGTGFSLWRTGTSIGLYSAGGNVTPQVDTDGRTNGSTFNAPAPEGSVGGVSRYVYPATLTVVAASGDVYYGDPAAQGGLYSQAASPVELAPAPAGQLEILAAGSINAVQRPASAPKLFDISGADPSVQSSPFSPSFSGVAGALPLFTNGADAANGTLHAADPQPARFYAANGSLIDVATGQTAGTGVPQYLAAKAVQLRAGTDIISSGSNNLLDPLAGNLFLNSRGSDVSVISAGRDIIYTSAQIKGPGQLDVSAGRNVYEGNLGTFVSTGPIGARSGGAGITVLAGVGAGPDYGAFVTRYLQSPLTGAAVADNPAAAAYLASLRPYLNATYGFMGTDAAAVAFLRALPGEQQATFLLPIYFDELRQSGREFGDPASVRYKSYVRGRDAIATLFPGGSGQGSITLFPQQNAAVTTLPGSSVVTEFGGSVRLLAPNGQVLLGSNALQTPAGQGVLTEGQGDIGIFSSGSVLLGNSRVFTTFGGGITIWSATGDVNAGRGSNSTNTFSPLLISYDPFGGITQSPSTTTSGAGIATLAPVAGVVPGDVDLIAPLGTIDAGEAGIRVSGNVFLSALTVVNAANIQVSGKSTGLAVVTAPNVAALASASTASAGSSQAAQAAARGREAQAAQTPSVIEVDVTSFGG